MQYADVIVRDANTNDVPIIARYNIDMALETENRHLDRSVVLNGVQAVVTSPELGRYFLAVSGEEVIGQAMITYEWSDWRSGMFWWLQSVYVRPDARRRGAFTAIFQHIREQARNTPGVIGLRLYVEKNNTTAQATYTRLGLHDSNYIIFEQDWSMN